MEKNRVKSALGGKSDHKDKKDSKEKSSKSKGKGDKKKHAHRLHISRTDNGKFLVDHEFKNDPMSDEAAMPGQSHAIEPGDLASHVTDSLGIGGGMPAPEAQPAAPVAAPTPTAAPAGPVGV